jgi:hypothetical protein
MASLSWFAEKSMRGVATVTMRALVVASLLAAVAACAPEIGSKRWCAAMRDKPRGDWSANEALDYARHCVLAGSDDTK